MTGPFILRRLKTDKTVIADLPDKLEMKVFCNLTAEQASLYQAAVDDMMARIEAAEPASSGAGSCWPRWRSSSRSATTRRTCSATAPGSTGARASWPGSRRSATRSSRPGDKALCFTQYAEFGRMLQPYLAARLGCEVLFLHGGMPKKRRDEMVSAFQDDGPSPRCSCCR